MKKSWERFNRGLNKDDFNHAFELKKQLKEEGITMGEFNDMNL